MLSASRSAIVQFVFRTTQLAETAVSNSRPNVTNKLNRNSSSARQNFDQSLSLRTGETNQVNCAIWQFKFARLDHYNPTQCAVFPSFAF